MSESKSELNGVIIIDKEAGMTSFDVVAAMRKICGTKKVGHTGTLDPDATGVLPVCVGNATKAADIMTDSGKKRYTAVMRLGASTDTEDASGRVISAGNASGITDEMISEAAKKFTGEIKQIPPMYSAIKMGGKKLYQLARQGITVEREERDITIYSIDIIKRDKNDVTMDVFCSKGTYIRTLCKDIGEYLGCGAHMAKLRRTGSGIFGIDRAVTLSTLRESQNPEKFIISTSELFDYPVLEVSGKQEWLVKNGVAAYIDGEYGKYRVFSGSGEFLCVSEIVDIEGKKCLKLIKSFYGGGNR